MASVEPSTTETKGKSPLKRRTPRVAKVNVAESSTVNQGTQRDTSGSEAHSDVGVNTTGSSTTNQGSDKGRSKRKAEGDIFEEQAKEQDHRDLEGIFISHQQEQLETLRRQEAESAVAHSVNVFRRFNEQPNATKNDGIPPMVQSEPPWGQRAAESGMFNLDAHQEMKELQGLLGTRLTSSQPPVFNFSGRTDSNFQFSHGINTIAPANPPVQTPPRNGSVQFTVSFNTSSLASASPRGQPQQPPPQQESTKTSVLQNTEDLDDDIDLSMM